MLLNIVAITKVKHRPPPQKKSSYWKVDDKQGNSVYGGIMGWSYEWDTAIWTFSFCFT